MRDYEDTLGLTCFNSLAGLMLLIKMMRQKRKMLGPMFALDWVSTASGLCHWTAR